MDAIFMNSENSITSESHTLLLSLPDKTDLKRSGKCETDLILTWSQIVL